MQRSNRETKKHKIKLSLKPGADATLSVCVFLLMAFGSLMIISTNMGEVTRQSNAVISVTIKQMIFICISYFFMWFVNHMFTFKRFAQLQYMFGLVFIGAMIAPIFFSQSGGSHAWIRIGSITIQPSEFSKPFLILLFAMALYQSKKNPSMLKSAKNLYRYPALMYAVCALILLVVQRDLGTLVILTMTCVACSLIPSFSTLTRFQRGLKRLIVGGILAVVLVFATGIAPTVLNAVGLGHVVTRIENTFNPYTDIYGDGYQPANALYGIADANVLGKGIGQSNRKYGYLTQADNDYILAVTLEETGIFGLTYLVLCYGTLISRLFYFAFKTNEPIYKIILGGTATYIFMHIFLNVGGVSGLIPFTGVPLLFISSGGSSLMAICIAIGLCQQCISRIKKKEGVPSAYRSR